MRRAREFHAELKRRRTVRHFSSRPVSRAIIDDCLRAATTAPSGANLQPWHFVVVGDPETKRRIREAAEEEERHFYEHRAPREWLDALAPLGTDEHKPFLEHAPWLIAIFAQKYGRLADGRKVKHYSRPDHRGDGRRSVPRVHPDHRRHRALHASHQLPHLPVHRGAVRLHGQRAALLVPAHGTALRRGDPVPGCGRLRGGDRLPGTRPRPLIPHRRRRGGGCRGARSPSPRARGSRGTWQSTGCSSYPCASTA